jgi:phenylacetic acid degradation operon negative regulatory protein
LFGLYARAEGNWLPIRGLVALMADLSVAPAAVRSSVSRLKRRGVLTAGGRDGRAGYALAASAVEVLRAGDERIWYRPRATGADGWLTVVFSVPEQERPKRHELRTLLTRLGFGTTAPGVWIAPAPVYQETRAALIRQHLDPYTSLFRGDFLGPAEVLRARVAQWWDLRATAELYRDFSRRHRPLRRRIATLDDRETFAVYVPMLTAWRRLPYLDPGIPLEYLPHGWAGLEAGEIFRALDDRLRPAAGRHAHRMFADGA